MMKLLFIIFFILCFYDCCAQPSDIIRLKNKRGRTIKMFFVDDYFTFETKDGLLRDGIIRNIKNDSVYISSFNIKTVTNYWGGNFIDTLRRYYDGFYYKDIKRILITKRTNIPITHLALPLKIGGLFFIFLNAVNSIYFHDSFTGRDNLIKVGIAAGAAATGFALGKTMSAGKFSKSTDIIEYIGERKK